MAATLDSLGYIAHHTGQHQEALGCYQQAFTLRREIGNTYQQANTLVRLGESHAALGDHAQAGQVWQQALELYQAQRRTADAERVQQQLDSLS